MNAAYCVDMRAFSIKVGSPSSSCLREVLQDRQRMLQARDAGEQAFCEELLRFDGECRSVDGENLGCC